MKPELLSTRRLALAGTIGPIVFVILVIVITVLEWDFLHQKGWHLVQGSSIPYPSTTAMGPYGFLQAVNFILVGLSVIAIGIGLWRGVQPRPRVGAGLVFLAGVAMVLSMFTTDGTTNAPTTWHGTIHSLAFILMLFSTLLASVALAIQLRNQDGWRGVARLSIATPIVIIATLFLTGAVKQAGGLLSIVSLLVIFGWYELLAIRLLSLAVKPLPAPSV